METRVGQHRRIHHHMVLALRIPHGRHDQARMPLPMDPGADRLRVAVIRLVQQIGIPLRQRPAIEQSRVAGHGIQLALPHHRLVVETRIAQEPGVPVVGRLVDRRLGRIAAVPDTERAVRETAGAPVMERPGDRVEPTGILERAMDHRCPRAVRRRPDLVFHLLRQRPFVRAIAQVVEQILRLPDRDDVADHVLVHVRQGQVRKQVIHGSVLLRHRRLRRHARGPGRRAPSAVRRIPSP